MQRKSVSKTTSKTTDLKARLKPISLEEPLTGSPFLKLIEDEPQKTVDSNHEIKVLKSREASIAAASAASSKPNELSDFKTDITPAINTKTATGDSLRQLEDENYLSHNSEITSAQPEEKKAVANNSIGRELPRKTVNPIAPRKLCKLLEVDGLDDIFSVTDLLKASSLKLYATLVVLADKNGRLKIKAHELMRAAGIKGIATYYKQERWLTELGLIEKRAKPGPHEGSSYRIYSLDSLPLSNEIIAEFDRYLREQSE